MDQQQLTKSSRTPLPPLLNTGGSAHVGDPLKDFLTKGGKLALTKAQQLRIQEILTGFGIPNEEQEEYLAILLGHLDMALDAYLSRFNDL